MAEHNTSDKTPEGKPAGQDWLKRVLECPGCQEVMPKGPVYECGNEEAHSLCSHCFKTTEKCPVCNGQLTTKRNLMVESIVDQMDQWVKTGPDTPEILALQSLEKLSLNTAKASANLGLKEAVTCAKQTQADEAVTCSNETQTDRSGPEVKTAAIPDWMEQGLECPVCLETIMDSPVFICENPQGHSMCSGCHESLQNNEDKKCPVCRKKLLMRRNVTLENMLENNPNKVKCRFDGCDYKRSDDEAVRKHEEDCENRLVPCSMCDENIPMKRVAEHISSDHGKGKFFYQGFSVKKEYTIGKECGKSAHVMAKEEGDDESPMFLSNWCRLEEGAKIFWLSYLGPKESAKKFKYTLQVKASENSEKYILEATKRCVPCDFSLEKVKRKMCAVVVEEDINEEDKKDHRLHYNVLIQKV